MLDIYYHNSTSIRYKSKSLYLSILEHNYDIICITETWLTVHFKTEEYFPSSYIVHRRDRHLQKDTYAKGGGVIVAVSDKFLSVPITITDCDAEIIATRIKYFSFSLVICATYIPPHSNMAIYEKFMNIMKSQIVPILQPEDRLVILGDFNIANVEWDYVDYNLTPLNLNSEVEYFMSELFSLGLKQCVHVKNKFGNILDLAFLPIDHEVTVSTCDDLAGSSSIFHLPLNISILFEFCEFDQNNSSLNSYNFKKGDYSSFNAFLDSYDWSLYYSKDSIDDMLSEFNSIINLGIEKYIPKSKALCVRKEPWHNSKLINLKNRKDKAHKKYKLYPNLINYNSFNVLRRKYTFLNRFLYNSYILEIESGIKSKPNRFWNFVNYKRKSAGYPSTMSLHGRVCDNPLEICNLFADFFQDVYTNSNLPNVYRISRNPKFSMFRLTVEDIVSELSTLDINQGTGVDSIPSIVLKATANVIAHPISALFNLSLANGYFPISWKCSFIKPIFKSGARSNIENYRGICILSVLPKLFEKLVTKQLFFHAKKFISSKQHGFYPGRSTVTNLLLLTNYISEALLDKNNVQVVYTDFSKAFDKIDHELLVLKLSSLDCNYLPIQWIKSYLDSRTQLVKIGNYISKTINVTSGVPQGSHLGPLLFILFINDVVNCVNHSNILIYADDIKIFKTTTNDKDAIDFQSDLTNFASWCKSQMLTLNVAKCKTMCFTRSRLVPNKDYFLDGCIIEKVDTFKDLGITFTTNLLFHKHIDGCISKANSMLGFIKRFSKDFHDPYVIKTLYISFVRSQLEYGAIIWDPFYANYSDRIESIQKRFLKFSLRRLPRDLNLPAFILPPYRGRCKLIKIEP